MGIENTEIMSGQVVDPAALEAKQILSSEDELLLSLGKVPELKRVFNFWTCELHFHLLR